MPDEYRAAVLKFVEMHANSELMGVLPERDWIMRAPTLRRKLALTSKIQDEVGHAQLLYRVAEDLGKPRWRCCRPARRQDEVPQRLPLPDASWADVGIIAWLVDAAAIVSQQALRDSSYAPYARTMQKICWEESVHIMHGRDVVLTMMNGTRGAAGDGAGGARPLVGPADADARPARRPGEGQETSTGGSRRRATSSCARSSSRSTSRASGSSGLNDPGPCPAPRRDDGRWQYTEPDWAELKSVVTGTVPRRSHASTSVARASRRRSGCATPSWDRSPPPSRDWPNDPGSFTP